MFQDDRMISILSAIVLMVAIGTVIQRADVFQDLMGSEEVETVLVPDIVDARPGRLLRINVLSNDQGLSDADREGLALLQEPECGQVFVQGGVLQYLPKDECAGTQRIRYGIAGKDGLVGEVIARMQGAGQQIAVETPRPEPQADTGTSGAAAVAKVETQPEQVAQPEQASQPRVAETEPAEPIAPNARVAQARLSDTEQPEAASDTATANAKAETPSVVDALIQGAATPVHAAVDPVKIGVSAGIEADAAVASASADAAAKALDPNTLAEPEVPNVQISSLGQPSEEREALQGVGTDTGSSVQRILNDRALSISDTPAPVNLVKPTRGAAVPVQNRIDPQEQAPSGPADRIDLAALGTSEDVAERPLHGDSGPEQDVGFLVAVVERREPSTIPPKAPVAAAASDLEPGRAAETTLPKVETRNARIALADPVQDIARPVDGLTPALQDSPVDTTQLPLDLSPATMSVLPPLKPSLAATQDAGAPVGHGQSTAPAQTSVARDAPGSPDAPSVQHLASLPQPDAPCVVPPAMTIDVRRAARSIISVDAPCHAETVAELSYSGLRVAMPLDREGKGVLEVLGFEPSAPALLSFINGEKIDFDLPFKGVHRISRIAVVWDTPVSLELNALEFESALGSQDHLRPGNARSFAEVRRNGGGFLDAYRSHSGIGQNAQIYTFWHRRGGRYGVVRLMIDFASRNRDRLDGTCGDGAYAAPNFLVLRSEDGRLQRPVIRKLAALDCSRITEEAGDNRLISGAVSDLVVLER